MYIYIEREREIFSFHLGCNVQVQLLDNGTINSYAFESTVFWFDIDHFVYSLSWNFGERALPALLFPSIATEYFRSNGRVWLFTLMFNPLVFIPPGISCSWSDWIAGRSSLEFTYTLHKQIWNVCMGWTS